MDNDKAFAIYAITIFAGLASVLTASLLAGYASIPSPPMFVEHPAMSLLFRAAYKSFGGPVWWPYPSAFEDGHEAAAAPAAGVVLSGPRGAELAEEDILDAA